MIDLFGRRLLASATGPSPNAQLCKDAITARGGRDQIAGVIFHSERGSTYTESPRNQGISFELVPQGGGGPATGHRCPGERVTIGLLETLCPRLAALDYDVPAQDLTIPVNRFPARVRSGMVPSALRPGQVGGRGGSTMTRDVDDG